MPDNRSVVIDIPFNGETRRLSAALTVVETVQDQLVQTWDWCVGTVHFLDGGVVEAHDVTQGITRCRSGVSIEALLYLMLEDFIRVKYGTRAHDVEKLRGA